MVATDRARPYDLANPPLLTPGEESLVLRRAGSLERAFAEVSEAYLGRPVRVSLRGLVEPGAAAGRAGLLHWFAPGGSGRVGTPWVGLETGLAGQIAAQMVGAQSTTLRGEPTAIERHLLRHFCGQVVSGCMASWGCPGVSAGPWRPSEAPEAGQSRAGLLLEFGASCGSREGVLALWLPAELVRAQMPGPSQPACAPPGPGASAVRQATVTATVILGTWRTTLAGLMDLAPGDTLPLGTPAGAPLELRVQGCAQLLVRPGLCKGRIAVQVLGSVSPECEFQEGSEVILAAGEV